MDEIFKVLYAFLDDYPAVPWLLVVFGIVWAWARLRRPAKQTGGLLSQVVFWWSKFDPVRVSDLLRAVAIMGATGAGKTTGAGLHIAKALVGMGRKAGGIIFASKPEDKEFWQQIFKKAGRSKDLLIFGKDSPLRFNMLDFLQRMGADVREITAAIMIMSETLRQSSNGARESEAFWRTQRERLVYNAVAIVGGAKGRITAPDLQKFISSAAVSPADLTTERFKKSFHQECLEVACENVSTVMGKHNYELALDFWITEYPTMDVKPRSSIVADTLGLLHVWNSGIVRELVSTTTNVSPTVVEDGKWVLVDTAISSEGVSGAFMLAGWKYLAQWYLLKRKATENTPVCALWSDEFQKIVNSFDATFLAECRSHRGFMVVLTQSIHALYTRMREGGDHEADSFLTNFYHKVFHAIGDDKTAAFGSGLVGKRMKTHIGGSMSPEDNVYDAMFGQMRFSGNFSQHMENILENNAFMQGLRTGGPEHGFIVDGIVVRSGECFSNGEHYLRVSFDQRS